MAKGYSARNGFGGSAGMMRQQQQMQQQMLRENAENLEQCRRHGCDYLLIDAEYPQEIILNV